MKNNKGFTLVELLAMLLVLGILMAVAIPNMSGILGSQRYNMIIADATKMVEAVKTKAAKINLPKPSAGYCYIYALDYINDADEINNGPNGGKYNQFDSFIIYTRVGNQYKYYVRLVEEKASRKFGVDVEEIDDVKKDNSKIKTITTTYNLSNNKANSMSILQSNTKISSICTAGILNYYVTQEE